MARRFNDLEEDILNVLRAGGSVNSLPASHPARKYWEWRTEPNSPSHDLPAASTRNRQSIVGVIISPFGYAVADNHTLVSISKRAAQWVQGRAQKAVLNHHAATQAHKVRDNFRPAIAYIRFVAAASRTETSRITGRKYKTRFDASNQGYLVPFGKTGTQTYPERQTAIKADFADFYVSFKPEIIGTPKVVFDTTV